MNEIKRCYNYIFRHRQRLLALNLDYHSDGNVTFKLIIEDGATVGFFFSAEAARANKALIDALRDLVVGEIDNNRNADRFASAWEGVLT